MTDTYDVLVIGSGTAGQTAAHELAGSGLTVALVEHRDRPGGTCALRGCQAKKWFYEGTEAVARSRHLTGLGISNAASGDWRALRDEKNRFTDSIPSDTVAGLKEAGIEFVRGRARFIAEDAMATAHRRLKARFIVLAAGAVPMPLPMEGAERMITSSEFLALDRLPRRIVFIGGGFISFEFAHFAARLGKQNTRATILEAAPRPLAPFDEEMVEILTAASRGEGIDVHCDVDITAIRKTGEDFVIETADGRSFAADLVVHGAGRAPDIDDLDLDRAGIERTKGGIQVDENMATTNSRVYAVGDCADTVQLARVADAEARSAAADILRRAGRRDRGRPMDYGAVPSVLFTYPQYGMVGATEDALKGEGVSYRKSFAKELSWPTYRRVGLTSAAYKLLAGDDGKLLGAHVISDNATGLIASITLAMVNGITARKLHRQSIMTPYPSRESDIIYMLKPLLD